MGEGVVVRPDQVSLGVLVNAVPRDLVDEAVAACGVRERRSDGKLPAHVITYLTLALTLFPDDDYTEVARSPARRTAQTGHPTRAQHVQVVDAVRARATPSRPP